MSDGHGKTWEMGDLHIEDEKISAAKKGIFERASNDSLRRDKNQLFLYLSADVHYYYEYYFLGSCFGQYILRG